MLYCYPTSVVSARPTVAATRASAKGRGAVGCISGAAPAHGGAIEAPTRRSRSRLSTRHLRAMPCSPRASPRPMTMATWRLAPWRVLRSAGLPPSVLVLLACGGATVASPTAPVSPVAPVPQTLANVFPGVAACLTLNITTLAQYFAASYRLVVGGMTGMRRCTRLRSRTEGSTCPFRG